MKRGQLEVLGLAMIVLLISVALLFVVKFVFLAPRSDLRQSFTQKQIGQNFLAAMAATSTSCQGSSIADLVEDCGRSYGEIFCPHPNGSILNSCDHAQLVIANLTNSTLNEWNIRYRISADPPDPGEDNLFREEPDPLNGLPPLYNVPTPFPTGAKQVKTHPVSLYPEPGVVVLRLEIFTD